MTTLFMADQSDSSDFLLQAERIVLRSAPQPRPSRVHLIKVDNWFDGKWLGFTGKVLGALGYGHPQELRLPPFHPNRIISEQSIAWDESAHGYRPLKSPALHIHQASSDNFQRRATKFLDGHSGRFVWLSGNSQLNGRGSLMVYEFDTRHHVGWYVELIQPSWKPHRCIGVSAAQVETYAGQFSIQPGLKAQAFVS